MAPATPCWLRPCFQDTNFKTGVSFFSLIIVFLVVIILFKVEY
jgi:hypothetical protein